MKRQPVDYSGFSLRRLNEPRFAHAKLLAGWLAYFALYFLTRSMISIRGIIVFPCIVAEHRSIHFRAVFSDNLFEKDKIAVMSLVNGNFCFGYRRA